LIKAAHTSFSDKSEKDIWEDDKPHHTQGKQAPIEAGEPCQCRVNDAHFIEISPNILKEMSEIVPQNY